MENHPPILTKHTGWPRKKYNNWSSWLTEEELAIIDPLLHQIQGLKDIGLTRAGVLRSFISHHIQPLKLWVNFGFEYLGVNYPSRMTSEELPAKDVLKRI